MAAEHIVELQGKLDHNKSKGRDESISILRGFAVDFHITRQNWQII